MVKKFVTFYLTMDTAAEIDSFDPHYNEVMLLIAQGATAGTSVDGKIGWRTYSADTDAELG